MKQNLGKFNRFNFDLSAFSSAASSVIDVMQRDYSRRPRGFDEWFKEVESVRTLQDQELNALMSHMRSSLPKIVQATRSQTFFDCRTRQDNCVDRAS